jgi:hypothetical protein
VRKKELETVLSLVPKLGQKHFVSCNRQESAHLFFFLLLTRAGTRARIPAMGAVRELVKEP